MVPCFALLDIQGVFILEGVIFIIYNQKTSKHGEDFDKIRREYLDLRIEVEGGKLSSDELEQKKKQLKEAKKRFALYWVGKTSPVKEEGGKSK